MPQARPSTGAHPQAFLLRPGPWLEGVTPASCSTATTAERLLDLAEALTSSPCWRTFTRARLVVRSEPLPILAIIGWFDDAETARVRTLQAQVLRDDSWIRYVDYPQAERDCQALGAALVDHFGREALTGFRFEGVPRGGIIVLGMLAYVLGLTPAQLAPAGDGDGRPVVLVDDCALSGLRFRDVLGATPAARVIFAPLYSPPVLREAIETAEPRVIACVGGRDLTDLAPERLGDEYPAWRERWVARERGEYWIGDPQHVAFAWNEPDITLWNAVTDRAEDAWRFIPPERCLKSRIAAADSARPVRLPACPGPLAPADDVVWAEFGDQVVVAAADGDSAHLAGVSAQMWRLLIESGHRSEALRLLSATYDVEPERLEADLDAFVKQLRDRSLLDSTA